LRAYQSILSEIQSLGAALVAISPQTPDNSLSSAEKNELKFPVLSDLGNAVARKYRLVFALAEQLRPLYLRLANIDLPRYNGDPSWELPVPGTFVVAKDGTVMLSFLDADYTRRLEPREILECLKQLAG
jgi:peroxiredoxin